MSRAMLPPPNCKQPGLGLSSGSEDLDAPPSILVALSRELVDKVLCLVRAGYYYSFLSVFLANNRIFEGPVREPLLLHTLTNDAY